MDKKLYVPLTTFLLVLFSQTKSMDSLATTSANCPHTLREATAPEPIMTSATPCAQTLSDSEQDSVILDISELTHDQVNDLIDTAAPDLVTKESVRGICCHNNGNIDGEILQKIINIFPFLGVLDLSGNSQFLIDDSIWPFKNLERLQFIDLSNTKINIDTLEYIADTIPELSRLNLSGCGQIFTPDDPDLISEPLFELWSYGTVSAPTRYVPRQERAIQTITRLRNLKELNISNTLVSDAVLEAVANLSELRKLNLHGCRNFEVDIMGRFCEEEEGEKNNFSTFAPIANLAQLEELDVSGTYIDLESIVYIVSKLKKLNKLVIPAALRADPVALDKIRAAARPGLSIMGA